MSIYIYIYVSYGPHPEKKTFQVYVCFVCYALLMLCFGVVEFHPTTTEMFWGPCGCACWRPTNACCPASPSEYCCSEWALPSTRDPRLGGRGWETARTTRTARAAKTGRRPGPRRVWVPGLGRARQGSPKSVHLVGFHGDDLFLEVRFYAVQGQLILSTNVDLRFECFYLWCCLLFCVLCYRLSCFA